MELDDFPSNWSLRRLSDLCNIHIGKTPTRANRTYWENGRNAWAVIADLNDGVVTKTREAISDLALQECRCKPVEPGTLLFSFKLTIGKMAFAARRLFTNEAIAALPVKDGVDLDPRFLALALKVVPLLADASDAAKGTTLNKDSLSELQIPVPLLAEQRRILERVEELIRRFNQAREARQAAVAEAKTFMTAEISGMFPNTDSWKSVRDAVSSRKGSVRNGPFGSQLLHHEFTESGVAAIGTRDVQANRFELRSGWFVSHAKFEQFRRYRVFPGDVLCTIVGASIGRFCVVPHDVPMAFTTKHIQALTLNLDAAVPAFVSCMLNYHPRCRESLFSQVEGSAQPSLNATKVLETALPLPPVDEQHRIVTRLDALETKMDEIQRLQRDVEVELVAFVPALLAKAFRGEL